MSTKQPMETLFNTPVLNPIGAGLKAVGVQSGFLDPRNSIATGKETLKNPTNFKSYIPGEGFSPANDFLRDKVIPKPPPADQSAWLGAHNTRLFTETYGGEADRLSSNYYYTAVTPPTGPGVDQARVNTIANSIISRSREIIRQRAEPGRAGTVFSGRGRS